MSNPKTLVVIPARGGSKGIPRKNLRPVAGKPLIYYSVTAALATESATTVVVSTDDDEIGLFASRFGATVLMRPASLADDKTTLDPVIHHALVACEDRDGVSYDYVVTVQPTSPLVTSSDIDEVVGVLLSGAYDTALTVVDDRHLCWGEKDGKPFPLYKARVNRQQLPLQFKETGAVIACTRKQLLDNGTRIGAAVGIKKVSQDRSFDIDSYSDLYLCESLLARKRIVFAVAGYPAIGLGHAYRATMLAHELVRHELLFVCEARDYSAIDHIRSHNYDVKVVPDGTLLEGVLETAPNLVINDILDTPVGYMRGLKEAGLAVVNFEDLGEGSVLADVVVNALYPHQIPSDKVLVGPAYFCLRDEFLFLPAAARDSHVRRVLITFGGVDEGNITARVLRLLLPILVENGIALDVVVGPGYSGDAELERELKAFPDAKVTVTKHTTRISDFMAAADIAITSGGRTVLELAAVGVPTLVICQNARETTHTFASSENGVINLGCHTDVSDVQIVEAFSKVMSDESLRKIMLEKQSRLDLSQGKKRVIDVITSLL